MNPVPVLAVLAAVFAMPAALADHGCGPGFEPVTKMTDGSAACVMPGTAQVLAERGWGEVPTEGAHQVQNVEFSESDVQEAVRNALSDYARLGDGTFESITASAGAYDASAPYVFVLDDGSEPTILAHGAAADTVDTVATPLLQADRPYRQVLADLRAAGDAGTWVQYVLNNPATDTVQTKNSFLILQDGYIFGSGYYTDSEGDGIMGFQLPALDLTGEERQWLQDNPQIRVSYDPGAVPYEYEDADGLAGLPTYYMPIFEGLTGADFVQVPTATWTDALESMKDGSSDALLVVAIDEARTEYMEFTEPHTRATWDIVTLAGGEDPRPLEEASVGTVENYAIEDWLDANMPDVKYRSYETTAAAAEALSSGEIDTLLQARVLAEAATGEALRDFGPIGEAVELAVGYPKDQDVLGSILQKAVDAVPQEARRTMAAQAVFDWGLTAAERKWMAENPVIRVGFDSDFPPYEYVGGPDGIAGLTPQYIRMLEQVTRLDYYPAQFESWTDALDATKEGRADMLTVIAETPQRTAYLGFTEPHTTVDWNMITTGSPVDIDDLASLKVGVVRDYAIGDWMSTNMPRVNLIEHDDHAAALGALSSGQIDVLLDTFEISQWAARDLDVDGLYDAGTIGDGLELSIAYQRGQEEFGSILQKALDTLSDEEKMAIAERAVSQALG